MSQVFKAAGVSKQAFHKYVIKERNLKPLLADLVVKADKLRGEHGGCGVERMYHTLKPDWLGRDQFIEYFMELGYRVKKPRNYIKTTTPVHSKYKNLIEGLLVMDKNRVWQSDITYFWAGTRFYYLVFILDVYTKEIIGYNISSNLKAESNIAALKMAIKNAGQDLDGLIHHSDRGSQYLDTTYLNILKTNSIQISMGDSAQANAYAERINGTVKNEYLSYKGITTEKLLTNEVKKAVNHYNGKRQHSALNRLSPSQFKKELLNLTDQKRPRVIIYANGRKIKKGKVSNFPLFRPEKDLQAHTCPIVNS